MTASLNVGTKFAATAFLTAVLCTSLAATQVARAAATCKAVSAAAAPPVVELYTSEGCNSCPPADRWLSKLKADPHVVALAFHVDYWDRLGWKDRFASSAYTQRQTQQQSSSGAGFSYTPQVIVNGRDRKDWARLGAPLAAPTAVPLNAPLATPTTADHDPASGPSPVGIEVVRENTGVGNERADHLVATVSASKGAPKRLAAYWAVTEQDHVTAVKAGENEGVTLQHDFVVREYRPVAGWAATPGIAATLRFDPASPADPAHPRQVDLVVIDADTGRPVQAVKLGC